MKQLTPLTINSNYIISEASPDDSLQIVSFLNKVAGETNFLTFGLNEFPLSADEERAIIEENLKVQSFLMLIAKKEDTIVAQLFMERSTKKRLAHIGEIGISVSKEHWGNSLGKKMMLLAIAWAKEHGITKIQLYVRTDNTRAIQLYAHLGFVIEGTLINATKINDIYYDDYIMSLHIK